MRWEKEVTRGLGAWGRYTGASRVVLLLLIGEKRGCGAALTHLVLHHPYLARVKSNGARSMEHGTRHRMRGVMHCDGPPYLCDSRVDESQSGMTESQHSKYDPEEDKEASWRRSRSDKRTDLAQGDHAVPNSQSSRK